MDGLTWDASSVADAIVNQTNLGTVRTKFQKKKLKPNSKNQTKRKNYK